MRLRVIIPIAFAAGCNLAEMKPGARCGGCHTSGGEAAKHAFGAAGTAYAAGHALDDGLVEITDARGVKVALRTNAAGNFYTEAPLALPLHVTLSKDGARASMPGVAPSGDCNGCHAGTHTIQLNQGRTR